MEALHAIARYLLPRRRRVRPPNRNVELALAATDELIERMRASSASNDPVRAIMANLWEQRHNVPYVTTIFEADAEMKSAVDSKRNGKGA